VSEVEKRKEEENERIGKHVDDMVFTSVFVLSVAVTTRFTKVAFTF
jgi:hypothetical protein